MQSGGYRENRRAMDAGRLRALAELGAALSAADEPLKALAIMLPAMLERLGIACDCRIAGPAAPAGPADLRAVIAVRDRGPQRRERPVAAIELRRPRGGQTLAAIPFCVEDRAFIDAVARLAGLAVAQAIPDLNPGQVARDELTAREAGDLRLRPPAVAEPRRRAG